MADYKKRNSSSDIWSLGCVFFEMCTVLTGRSIQAMRQHFKKLHDTYKFYQCHPAIRRWSEDLHKLRLESDNIPLDWAEGMMQPKPESRPSANGLCSEIIGLVSKSDEETKRFCGDCCGSSNDSGSTSGSVSDGDLWAENLDDEITSPAASEFISDLATVPSILRMGPQLESEVDHVNAQNRSMSWSSTRDTTAVQQINVEPVRAADVSLAMPIDARTKASEEELTQTCTVIPIEAPVD